MTKKNYLAALASLACVATLTACGGTEATPRPTHAPVEAASPSTAPTSEGPLRSERGALIKEVGEPAGIRTEEGSDDWALSFTVTSIEVDPVCTTEFGWPSENGHMVALRIEALTAPEPILADAGMTGASFHPYYWKAIAPNGTTANTVYSSAADNCFPQSEMLPEIGPGEKVVGYVVLDVPAPAGTLVYSYGDGWEWEYGTE